jgi:WD40 repeat protein
MRYCAVWAVAIVLLMRAAAAQAAEMRPVDLVRRYGKAVVLIATRTTEGGVGQGTGFLVSPNGMVVTNQHVIAGAASIKVRLLNSRIAVAGRVVCSDPAKDLAILKIGGSNYPTVRLGEAGRVGVGAHLYVIGNPQGLENTITDGLLSARRYWDSHQLLQISAPISPGSSGSPVFDSGGRVIGVAMAILMGGQNLNLAVPINDVRQLMQGQTRRALVATRPRRAVRHVGSRLRKEVQSGPPVFVSRHVLPGHSDLDTWIRWSPDGHMLAASGSVIDRSEDPMVQVWNVASRQPSVLARWPGCAHVSVYPESVAWSPDGRYLACALRKKVRVWDATGKCQFATLTDSSPLYNSDIAWSPDGKRLAYHDEDQVKIWNPNSRGAPIPMEGHWNCSDCFTWSRDGKRLIAVCSKGKNRDGALYLWDTISGRRLHALTGGLSHCFQIAWSPDGRRLAAIGSTDNVRIWETVTWRQEASFSGHSDPKAPELGRLCWSPSGRQLAVYSAGGLRIWDAIRKREVACLGKTSLGRGEWAPRGRQLAWIDRREHVNIWDAATGKRTEMSGLSSWSFHVAWSPNGHYLAASSGCEVRLMDIQRRRVIILRAIGYCDPWNVAWSPDGRHLAAGCEDGTVHLWDLKGQRSFPAKNSRSR